jgi:hypothetical protein
MCGEMKVHSFFVPKINITGALKLNKYDSTVYVTGDKIKANKMGIFVSAV